MKRILVIVLAAIVITALYACYPKDVTEDDSIPTIVWYVPGNKQPDTGLVMEEANKVLEDRLGVRLDVQFVDVAAYTYRMNMYFASGVDDFDLCFTGYVNPYRDAVIRGAYYEISELVENSEIIKREIPEYAIKCAMMDNELYGLPNMQIMATGCTGLFIQKSLAEEYGLKTEEIKHLEDIEPFLEWVKETHPGLYPFRTGRMSGGTKEQIHTDSPTSLIFVKKEKNGELDIYSSIDGNGLQYESKLMRSWFEKGYIRADVASAGDDAQEQAAGKFAVWRSVYKPGAAAEYNANNPRNECICIQISDAYMPYNAGSTAMTAINLNSRYPKKAFEVYELILDDRDLYNLLCYGIEGKHYTLNKSGKVVYSDDSGYKPGGGWKFGSVYNSFLIEGQPDDLWEQTREFDRNSIKSPIMGFSFDQSEVRTEVAQIETVRSKYQQSATGAESEAQWYDSFVRELKEAGIETVRAEVERQLNEWYEKNKN